jgi:hypothetical protein
MGGRLSVRGGTYISPKQIAKEIQNSITKAWKEEDSVSREWKEENPGVTISKRQLRSRRYIHTKVAAIGKHKAREKSLGIVQRSSSICKLVYSHDDLYNILLSKLTPVEFCYKIKETEYVEQGPGIILASRLIRRSEAQDIMMLDITTMVMKTNRNLLEKALINAIDVFGMIEKSTPIQAKFNLCIISLESLLNP